MVDKTVYNFVKETEAIGWFIGQIIKDRERFLTFSYSYGVVDMKSKMFSVVVIPLLIMMLSSSLYVCASDGEFATESLSTDTENLFLNNIELMIIDHEPEKRSIECFSVNNDQNIAIGFSNFDNKTICVYNRYGEFQYGYKFKTSGKFAVEWDESNIGICFARSDVRLEVTPEGDFVEIAEIRDTIENNTHWNNILYSTKQTLDDTEFVIKNRIRVFDVFSSSYSHLIAIDEYGNETTIYVADSTQTVANIAIILMVVVFVFLTINKIKEIKKHK